MEAEDKTITLSRTHACFHHATDVSEQRVKAFELVARRPRFMLAVRMAGFVGRLQLKLFESTGLSAGGSKVWSNGDAASRGTGLPFEVASTATGDQLKGRRAFVRSNEGERSRQAACVGKGQGESRG